MRILPLNGYLHWISSKSTRITSKSTWQYKFPDCFQARLPGLDDRKVLTHTKPKCPPACRHPVLWRLSPEENLLNISKNNISLCTLCQNKLLVFSLCKHSNSIAIGNSAALNLKIHPINPIKKTTEEQKSRCYSNTFQEHGQATFMQLQRDGQDDLDYVSFLLYQELLWFYNYIKQNHALFRLQVVPNVISMERQDI